MKTAKVTTKRFGELEVSDEKIITVKNGILGFIYKDLFNPFYYEKQLIIKDVLIESVIKNNILEQKITFI